MIQAGYFNIVSFSLRNFLLSLYQIITSKFVKYADVSHRKSDTDRSFSRKRLMQQIYATDISIQSGDSIFIL